MTRPPSPDWLEALRRPPSDLAATDAHKGPVVCTRCRRPAKSLESWLERRRLRTPEAGAPGGFRYSHRIKEHLLCGPCYLEVRQGRPAVRHNGLKIMAVVAAGAVALAAALPLAMPNLMAAFWQNGAAPDGWGHTHRPGHPLFLQGRD